MINREEDRRNAAYDRKRRLSCARDATARRTAREARHATEALGEALAVAERFLSPTDRRMRREARVEAELRCMAAEDGSASIQGFVGSVASKIGGDLTIKSISRREAEKVFGGGE